MKVELQENVGTNSVHGNNGATTRAVTSHAAPVITVVHVPIHGQHNGVNVCGEASLIIGFGWCKCLKLMCRKRTPCSSDGRKSGGAYPFLPTFPPPMYVRFMLSETWENTLTPVVSNVQSLYCGMAQLHVWLAQLQDAVVAGKSFSTVTAAS
ncbi:hypothetical protein BD410DRAFT_802775 [Rickenella mellea]|uniref:Uncharacterized protein n=1 Tax=Rickenella mellea TaxID=50990 RepID=A0A4Y7Q8W6_9AGAM|nr:hypothetical protein BD410DRAFT_802775 [Rickenella mellea]